MIRQAHTYLVGALSGVVVIGIAIAAFVVLVSAQVFHDLPIPALSSSDQKAAAVSEGKALNSPDRQAVATTGVSTGTIQLNHPAGNANAAGGGNTGATKSQPTHHQANPAAPTEDATGPAEVVEDAPSTSTETGNTGSTSSGGNSGGSRSSQPSSNSQSSAAPTSDGAGGNTTSTSGSSGNSSSPTPTSGSGGNGGAATGTSGGGSTSTSPPAIPVTTAKPSEAITEGVNGAVGTVDEAVGGTLSESGVTHVTEEAVSGVAGPESVVGKTVDGVGEVVGGLLGGHGE
jgi:hypothetical protein